MTFASTAAGFVVGAVGFRTQTFQSGPCGANLQKCERQYLQSGLQQRRLLPRLPDRTTALGAIRGAVGLAVHAAPDREDSAAKQKGDWHDLEDRFHSRTTVVISACAEKIRILEGFGINWILFRRSIGLKNLNLSKNFGQLGWKREGLHSLYACSMHRCETYIGALCGARSRSVEKHCLNRVNAPMSQNEFVGLKALNRSISVGEDQQEISICNESSIGCQPAGHSTAAVGHLRALLWVRQCLCFWLGVLSSRCGATALPSSRLSRRRSIPTSKPLYRGELGFSALAVLYLYPSAVRSGGAFVWFERQVAPC
jgi:hypothetical protein